MTLPAVAQGPPAIDVMFSDPGPVDCLAVSPDGATVAVSDAQRIKLFRTADGVLVRTIVSNPNSISVVAFSPDGSVIATGGTAADANVRLWRVSDGALIQTLLPHGSYINAVAFSRDGQFVASADLNHRARVWRTSDGTLVRDFGHSAPVYSVAFTVDSLSLVTSDNSAGGIRVFRLADGQVTRTLQSSAGSALLSASPDGVTLACRIGWRISLYSLATGLRIRTLDDEDLNTINGLSFSSDGARLASCAGLGDADGFNAKVWDVTTGTRRLRIGGFQGQPRGIAFLPGDSRMITADAGPSPTVKFWDTESGMSLGSISGPAVVPLALDFSPDSREITAAADPLIRTWNLSTHAQSPILAYQRDTARVVAASPDGQIIASGGADGALWLWRTADGAPIGTVAAHARPINSVAFSSDGLYLATGSDDNTARIWHAEDLSSLHTLEGHSSNIVIVVFSPDSQHLFTFGGASYKRWRVSDGALIGTFEHGFAVGTFYRAAAFSPDGQWLAMSTDSGYVAMSRTTDFRVVAHVDEDTSVRALAFSPDSQRIAYGRSDSIVRLNTLDFSVLRQWDAHSGTFFATAFSPDGQTILTSGSNLGGPSALAQWRIKDGTFVRGFTSVAPTSLAVPGNMPLIASGGTFAPQLWSLGDGRLLNVFGSHGRSLTGVRRSADGDTLITTSGDGSIKLWSLGKGALVRTMTGHTGGIASLALEPSANIIATGGSDATVRLWSLSDGSLLWTSNSHTAPVNSVAISPDGQHVASAANNRFVRVHQAADGAPVRSRWSICFPRTWRPRAGTTFPRTRSVLTETGWETWFCCDPQTTGQWGTSRLPKRGPFC